MSDSPIITNERDAQKARTTLARIGDLLSAEATLQAAKCGLPPSVIEIHRRSVSATDTRLRRTLDAYEKAKEGDYAELSAAWRKDPGVILIIARIAQGMSQGELALKLGMRQQQIQRYEAERYRSISLQNYSRIARTVGVDLYAEIPEANITQFRHLIDAKQTSVSDDEIAGIAAHVRKQGWMKLPSNRAEQKQIFFEFVEDSNSKLGNPALLRTGLDSLDLESDFSLAVWRARVVRQAEVSMERHPTQFDSLDISWLPELVRLSVLADGPQRALDMIRGKGIAVVIETQIPGLRLDGAAFLVNGVPVIGLTIRHDRIDNFWFTLLHELAHVFLHGQAGLASGFCDDLDKEHKDDLEREANEFAGAMLIPSERWKVSPARIAKSPALIEEFARQIGIHPAIVYGRIRKERGDYSVFSEHLGTGAVRSRVMTD
jgi:HTH-type transcriptional regulator / antitoxin HigA